MSRTFHLRPGQDRTHRARAPTRLTRLPVGTYYSAPDERPFDGNEWRGTVAHIGGAARREAQRAQALNKVLGRRRERRIRNRAAHDV